MTAPTTEAGKRLMTLTARTFFWRYAHRQDGEFDAASDILPILLAIEAEATAAAEQRLATVAKVAAELRITPEQIEDGLASLAADHFGSARDESYVRVAAETMARVLRALSADTPPPAPPRQGEPVDVERLSIAMNRAYTYGTGTAEQVAAEYAALSEPAEAGEPADG